MQPRVLVNELEKRRQELGMSCAAVGKRADLSLRTVQRLLSGSDISPRYATLSAVANALGVQIGIQPLAKVQTLRRRQAEAKADQLVALTQGTSALESQALPPDALASLKSRTVNQLLSGSSRKLWG